MINIITHANGSCGVGFLLLKTCAVLRVGFLCYSAPFTQAMLATLGFPCITWFFCACSLSQSAIRKKHCQHGSWHCCECWHLLVAVAMNLLDHTLISLFIDMFAHFAQSCVLPNSVCCCHQYNILM